MCNMVLSESQINTLEYALFRLICCRSVFFRLKCLSVMRYPFCKNILDYAAYLDYAYSMAEHFICA